MMSCQCYLTFYMQISNMISFFGFEGMLLYCLTLRLAGKSLNRSWIIGCLSVQYRDFNSLICPMNWSLKYYFIPPVALVSC